MPAGWTLVENHPTQGRTFKRPLDVIEVRYLWYGLLHGGEDLMPYCQLRLLNGARDAHLFSRENIVRAWVSTKRRYPLAGAIVRGADNAPLRPKEEEATGSSAEGLDNGTGFTSEPHFIIREHDLSAPRPGEIVFETIAHAGEAQQRMTALSNGPRLVSDDSLSKLYVFHETNPERADVLHLMAPVAHCIADRFGMTAFLRCLLDTLARGPESEPPQMPLEDRLAMAIPSMDLEPVRLRSLSPAVRRWRRAIGMVIFQLKMARRQGGHTLPCRLMRSTPYLPGRSDMTSTSLTAVESANVIANCRSLDITFGNAFLALAQVAMTRVLYRRYLRGEISEEEWVYRKRQPHNSSGPLNLRPYLDRTWLANGGAGEFMLSVAIFLYQLPFMSLGETERQENERLVLSDGAPPFFDLLSFGRFLHRTRLVKKQTVAFRKHPLFFEIARAAALHDIQETWRNALRWTKRDGAANHEDDEVLAVTDFPTVLGFRGSSVGDVDLMSPTEYPIPPTHPLSPSAPDPNPFKAGYVTPPPDSSPAFEADATPKIVVESAGTHIQARPMELYLSAGTLNGRLTMYVFYDRNVFEEEVVKEWLDQVREAVLLYLGQTHRSCEKVRPSMDEGGEGVQAKL